MKNKLGNRKFKISLAIFIIILGFSVAYYINWKGLDTDRGNEINSIFTQADDAYFDPVLPNAPLHFPADFNSHLSFQHEKWMMTVNAINHEGDRVGIQWTMVRISSDDRETKGWLDPRLYMAKIVITTKDGKWVGDRLARGGIGQTGVASRPYRIWIDDWRWRSSGRTPFPGLFSAVAEDFSLKLSINSTNNPVPLGESGYSKKHELIPVASYEYIFPFLTVRGNITLNNKVYTIAGTAILDHEWTSGFLNDNQQGFDWFIINLNNNRKLLVAQYRYKDQTPYRYGVLLDKQGGFISLSDDDFSLQVLSVRPLKNGRELPLQWSVNVPKYNINVTTQVVRSEQWLDTFIPYWQGPITTTGSHDVSGFMKLTGY